MKSLRFSTLSLLFSMTDEQAMWRVQTEDDPGAFAQLVRRWEGPIRDLCTRMTGDLHAGEDLAQEAFARVFAKRASYRQSARFSTWLWRIALNACYDELRRRRQRSEVPLVDEADESGESLAQPDECVALPDAHLVALEEGELVRRALLQLPEIYRAVLVLRHYEDLKIAKIAEILEIPEGTVHSRLAEGLARLTRLLEPRLGDAPAGLARRDSSNQHPHSAAKPPPNPGGTSSASPRQMDGARVTHPSEAMLAAHEDSEFLRYRKSLVL
jgi:RNA polymerase sigma-70 factor, ECF subfamily